MEDNNASGETLLSDPVRGVKANEVARRASDETLVSDPVGGVKANDVARRATAPHALVEEGGSYVPQLLFEQLRYEIDLSVFRLTSFSQLMMTGDDVDDDSTEGTMLLVCLLAVRHANKDGDQTTYAFRNGAGAANKKRKSTVNYVRMHYYGDPRTPQRCGALFETQKEGMSERRLWQASISVRSNGQVGSWFVIPEPQKISQVTSIGGFLKLETNWPIFPVKAPPLTYYCVVPNTPNQVVTYYFKGVKVEIPQTSSVFSNCSGSFCDRQKSTDERCGCYSTDRTASTSFVLETRIKINHDGHIIRAKFCSWQFTKMIFKNEAVSNIIDPSALRRRIARIRTAVKALVDLVNAKGGFTVIGWYILGEGGKRDEQESASMSETAKYYVIKLIPTEQKDLTDFQGSQHALDTADFA
jgi:hypothetical protein